MQKRILNIVLFSLFFVLYANAEEVKNLKIKDIYTQYKNLINQTIQIEGNVTKVMPHILDKTWVHVRDGSGVDKKTEELKFITTEKNNIPITGDQVIAKGIVTFDKTFGLIIKDASFVIK